jgi:type I restriction enzyme M protein
MKTITVVCFAHFVEVTTSDRVSGRIFRGVSDLDAHKLVPPIGRKPRWSGLRLNKLASTERGMLKRFKQEGAPFVSAPLSDWEWIVLARHHELPGRLLDWSKNPLVALYFAVQRGNEREGAVYAENFTRTLQIAKETDPFSVTKVSRLNPIHSHPRISAQASVLTIHPVPRVAYESKSLLCLRVAGKLKRDFKQALRRLGIHPATMYPGLDGVAETIIS